MNINQNAALVDNYISSDDIFIYHPIKDCNINLIIIPKNIFISSLFPHNTMVWEDPKATECVNAYLPC